MACCIHPAFIQDQLARSLERLNLATVDIYLLHNPEYYLSWASAQGIAGTTARAEYDRRRFSRRLEGAVTSKMDGIGCL